MFETGCCAPAVKGTPAGETTIPAAKTAAIARRIAVSFAAASYVLRTKY
jgi:hypothetical protein